MDIACRATALEAGWFIVRGHWSVSGGRCHHLCVCRLCVCVCVWCVCVFPAAASCKHVELSWRELLKRHHPSKTLNSIVYIQGTRR